MTNAAGAVPSRNQSVDAFRLLAALSVIILHVEYPNLPSAIPIGLRLMSRWAIPFFFIISGYFLANPGVTSKRLNVQSAVERLIWVFLVWSFIYAWVVIYQYDLAMSIKRIVSPYFIYFGNFVHLWFIPSLIFGYLMIAFCLNFNLRGLLIVLSILAIVSALLAGPYSIVDLKLPPDMTTASVWLSIPFLYIGSVLRRRGPPPWWVAVLLIVFGAALQIFEARFLYDKFGSSPYEHEFLIGTLPFGIGMAALALNDLKFLQQSVLSRWGREYSLAIYLVHPLIAITLFAFIGRIWAAVLANPVWQLMAPLVILGLSIGAFSLLNRFFPAGFRFLLGRKQNSNS